MAYIYKIMNIVNNKVYVGATKRSIEKRWSEHVYDCGRDDRPLHIAMMKYGLENFKKELIEEVDDSEMNYRECFWIEKLDTFKNGYNATFGGEGSQRIDYDLVVSTYQEIKSIKRVSEILNINHDYVSMILKNNKINIISGAEQMKSNGKKVLMIDKLENQLKFESLSDAGRYILNKGLANGSHSSVRLHISQCINGDRKSAYGCIWKLVVDN